MPRRHRGGHHLRRRRPPGRRRAGLPDALRASLHWLAQADGRLCKSEGRGARREAGRLTADLRDLPFAEQYAAWQRARWHLGLGEGPVDILSTRGDTLLAAWFAGTSHVCHDSLLQRAAGDDLVALRACDAVQGLRHADGRRRALDRISRLLRLWRLPARGVKAVRWPTKAAGCTAAAALGEVRACLTGRGRRLWRWVRERTRVVLPRRQTHSSHWNHIRCARAADVTALLATGAARGPPAAGDQASMERVKRYWKLPVAVTRARALYQGRCEVHEWARRCFGASYSGRPPARPGRLEALERLRGAPAGDSELSAYAACLAPPAEGEVLVQEDKDKSAAWRMPVQVYVHWMVYLLVADATHWRRVDCTVREVSEFYRHLHRLVLPARFRYMAAPHRWARFGLNYMYMNLKAKCFEHGRGRVCQKNGHSCLRKVVSWRTHPAVDYYRWVARGVQTLVTAWGRGYDVSSLKTAAAELRAKVAALSGPGAGRSVGAGRRVSCPTDCTRCGAHMPGPAVVVADAAQMYEEVPPDRVRQGLRSLISWAAELGYVGVAVCKRSSGPSFLVRQRWRHPPGSVLFTWEELRLGMDLALAQSAVSVGDSVWRQAEGLPIGGPHSPASCSVVLGADEAAWTADAAARALHRFLPEGRRLSEQVALARYVDDLIMVSRVWCHACLEDMLTAMYRRPVQFDRQATSAHGQPWLDMWVSFRCGQLEIHMDGQEQEWVQCLAARPPAKFRLKPYLGDEEDSLEALRQHVSGRTARLKQAGLEGEALRKAVEREILVLALHGYPRELLLRVWSRARQYPAAARLGRQVLQVWGSVLPGLVRLRPDWA